MELTSEQQGTVTVLRPAGSVDASATDAFNGAIQDEVRLGRTRLVIDLSDVDYMASAGLRGILSGLKTARQAGGDLRIAAPRSAVLDVLNLAGVTALVRTFKDVDSALASFEYE